MSITMTMADYQRLMGTLHNEFTAARGLGREEGIRAMDGVARQLSDLVERMFQEGRGLHQQCETLEATLRDERQKAGLWVEQTRSDLQDQAQKWVKD